ncbi:MAG TPA: M48 family metallopeptidase [Terriglobales bacterium]|nr:M48 family metallopeptidase [Terriglobales bacterium]
MTVRKTALLTFILLFATLAFAQPPGANEMPSVVVVPDAARASDHFDATAATNAYLAQIPPEKTLRSNNYFEGGYWLILWDFLYGIVVALILLNTRWSAKMRDLSERITRFKPIQTFLYWLQYSVIAGILTFPMTAYESYFREHKYGMATQTFGPWFVDQLKGLGIGVVLGGILVVLLFGVVRRYPRAWPILGAGVSYVFLIFTIFIAPVILVPIFNKVTPLNDPKIVDPILRLARQNGIPAKDVYTIDASRQTTQMSANVSGFGKTMRITLNDNLLRRGSPEEIQAVMGHEMGHYVLNHVYKGLTFGLIMVVIFWVYLRGTVDTALRSRGEKWQIRGIGDTAIVPLVILLASIFGFVMTPVMNSYIRTQEYEADMYGLNTSRQPDGFAQAAIHLGEYRKMSPGPLEEMIFFDHPSGRNRIYAAMRWRAENLQLFSPPQETAPTTAEAVAQPTDPGKK